MCSPTTKFKHSGTPTTTYRFTFFSKKKHMPYSSTFVCSLISSRSQSLRVFLKHPTREMSSAFTVVTMTIKNRSRLEEPSSAPTEFLVIDPFSPVFKYQRIEVGTVFGPHGKAESAHLIPKADCHDNDDNNRLALSAEMHAAYDGMTFDFPVVNMEVVGVSKLPVLDNRYKVDLHVSVHSKHYAFLLERLKENSARTSDPLVMKTFVYVKDPVIFCKNMAWKHQNVKQFRQDYFNSAVM